jgi:hypothetical protein
LEAATTRYRQGKKVKDINKSEWTLQREKNVSRKNDRGVGRAVSSGSFIDELFVYLVGVLIGYSFFIRRHLPQLSVMGLNALLRMRQLVQLIFIETKNQA